MQEKPGALALMRVLAAVAWADGVITPEERALLTRLAGAFGLSGADQETVLALLESPVGIEHFEELAGELHGRIHTPLDRAETLYRIEEMAAANHQRSPEETALLARLRALFGEEAPSKTVVPGHPDLLHRMKDALSEFGREHGAAGRPAFPFAARLTEALHADRGSTRLDPQHWRFVTLVAALLERVARAESLSRARETDRVSEVLRSEFGFGAEEIDRVRALLSETEADAADRQHLCAEFNRISEMEARLRLLAACFRVALADGALTEAEEKEIRLISNYLWIETQEYVRIRKEASDSRTSRVELDDQS